MKKLVLASLLALGTTTLLAGCGLIPAQTVANPLGLKDAVMTSSVLSTTSSSVSTRVPGTGTANVSATFADFAPLPLTPAKADITLELANATFSQGCAAAAGQTSIQITVSNIVVNLSDDTTKPDRTLSATLPTVSFSVNPTTGVISGLSASDLKFSFADLGKAINILTSTPTPNTATVTSNIATSPALPGCTVSIKLGAGNGIFSF